MGPVVPLDGGTGESLEAHGINRQYPEGVNCIVFNKITTVWNVEKLSSRQCFWKCRTFRQ